MKIFVVLTLMSMLLVGAFVPVSAQSPLFTETECEMALPAGEIEGETFICGYVEVPESHINPTGETIRLSVAIIKGRGTAPDPLVMFTGGPGGDIFNLVVPMVSEIGAPVRDFRDIVLMSERGAVGADPELTCPEVGETLAGHFGAPLEEVNALQLEGFQKCRDRWVSEGVDLNHYNNPERAADIPLVMEALGYESYNLWGVSGGGILAQYVLREHPEGVRTLMTDSGAFPNAYIGTVFSTLYTNISRAYRLLFETCAADAGCNETYPNLEENFWATIDSLNAEPVLIPITDPATGETVDFSLTGDVAINLLSNQFGGVGNLPAVMTEMANGDFSFMAKLAPSFYINDGSYADALYESVFCSEINQFTEADLNTEGAYPQVVSGIQGQIQYSIELCKLWDVQHVPMGEVLTSDVPILIMEGLFDTNKPPELGQEVANNFTTSYLAEFDGMAHVTFSPCALQMMGEFMNDPAQAPDMSCVPTVTNFVLASDTLTFSEVTFDSLGIRTIIPDGWLEVDAGTFVNPEGDVFLVLTAFPGDDIQAIVDSFAEIVNLPPLAKLSEETINDQTWELYVVVDSGRGSLVAVTIKGENVYLAGIQAPEADFTQLAETILQPLVEGITFN